METEFPVRNQNITTDIWNDATTFAGVLESFSPDLIIATDLASGIASLVLKQRNGSSHLWYDAHEFGSEQAWIKRRPGFTPELKNIELKIIQNSELFSCVSDELTSLMIKEAERLGPSVTLPNIVLPEVVFDKTSINSQLTFLRELRKSRKLAMFHGVLSDIRGIDKFVEAFDIAGGDEWCLVLMGYFLENKTSQAVSKSKNAHLISPVAAQYVLDIISEVDAVVMPYQIVDINTQYSFPNKLGDCLATQKKFIFNSGLDSISIIAERFGIGGAFTLENTEVDTDSLSASLKQLDDLNPDWNAVEQSFGESRYEKIISGAIKMFTN
jgi:glycosyltransferase involved in cell wall biosynthesis